jgi:TolB-like protein/class 3 adenylate cyclase/Tfp pilus assembly protein PilF
MERRLAAILAADVVGYSRLIREDEAGTLAALKTDRENLFEPKVAERNGRIVKLMGDGLLIEFSSAVEAVHCAVEIQQMIIQGNADTPEAKRIDYRIGINIGDIVVEGDDIHGDGVNLAARLEGLADPSGICVARNVFDQVKDKLDLTIEHMGERNVKNISEPITVYRILLDDKAAALLTPVTQISARQPAKRRITVLAAVFVLAIGGAVWWQFWPPNLQPATVESIPSRLAGKPSIAVLPFDNMSGEPEQEYLTDGMTEDLITDLAKTFAYKGKSPDVRDVAENLNVRFVVEGSVRTAGGRIRINAQLIDAATGAHVWAERYDREMTNVFDLQDEVRERIVAALQIELTPAEEKRLARHLTDNPDAYDAYLRGLQQESFFTKEGNIESQRLFEKAIELDPTFAGAIGKLATAHTLAAETGWTSTPEESLETARLLADKAVALDDELPEAHWAVARVYSRKRLFDGDRAIASLRKAIALDPNYADGHAMLSVVLSFVGRSEEGLAHIETAMRLNPHFPFWYYYTLGANQFMLTRYEAAIESFEKAIERNSSWQSSHRIIIAAYGHLGMIEEAEWEMEELRMLGFEPTLANIKSRAQFQDPAYLARFIDGLRKAGVPEE